MSAQTFPNSPMGLPSSVNFNLPASLSDSCRSYSVSVSPDGQTSVVGPTPIATPFIANGAANFGNYSAQNITFTIPSGNSESVFLDPTCTNVSFSLTYTVTTASSATNALMTLLGSGASWIDTLTLYNNNSPVETINSYGLLQNFLLNNTVNNAERTGGVGVSMGCDNNSQNGIDLAHTGAATTYRYTFCIPLLSVIGVNTSDKLIPIGSIQNMMLQLTTANITPIGSYCTAVVSQPVLTPFILADWSLNMKYIDLGDLSAQMLRQTLQNGKWYIKSSTYTNASVNIPVGTAGSVQSMLQIRNTSCKSVYHTYGFAQGGATPSGLYDAVNVGLTSRQLVCSGSYYPNKPLNDCRDPAIAYTYLINAFGGGLAKSLGTIVARDTYNSILPSIPAGSDSSLIIPNINGTRPPAVGSDLGNQIIVKFPSMAYYGYDLEKVAGSVLFQGINTRASPPMINTVFGVASTANITLQSWGYSDIVLEIDVNTKQITPYI